MAENGTPAETPEEGAERGPTRRVVMQREDVLVLPADVSDEQVRDALAALYGKRAPKGARAEGWIAVGEFDGHSKDAAIRAYAGEAGTPDAKIGAWKAPTARSWAGGVKHSAPPKPLVQREAID